MVSFLKCLNWFQDWIAIYYRFLCKTQLHNVWKGWCHILQNSNAILSSDNIIDFLQGSVKKKKKKIAWSFNFTFTIQCIYMPFHWLIQRLCDFVDHIYPIELAELQIQPGLFLTLAYRHKLIGSFENETLWQDFPNVNFPVIYQEFWDRVLLLIRKLLSQRFLVVKLMSYLRHQDLV